MTTCPSSTGHPKKKTCNINISGLARTLLKYYPEQGIGAMQLTIAGLE